MSKQLQNIMVKKFHTTFFMPMTLLDAEKATKILAEDKNWKQVDYIEQQNESPQKRAGFYNEYAYFHSFVRDFLYNKKETLKIYERDIKQMRFEYNNKFTLELKIERLNLFVFSNNVAFLVLEVSSENISLTHLLDFHDKARRYYPPFFEYEYGNINHTHEKINIYWDDKKFNGGDSLSRLYVENEQKYLPLSYWGHLLPPSLLKQVSFADDDRMPIISHITLKNKADYKKLKAGDWSRIAFVDGAGDDNYPAAKDFLAQYDANFYDRFHYQSDKESSDAPLRYCLSGYSFIGVGVGDYFEKVVLPHFQRQYFQIMLIAQYEFATLLNFSTRMSEAVKDYTDDKFDEFRLKMQAIQHDFLHYTHRAHFTGVTNQLQGQELNALLRKNMGLDTLYNDVKEEIASSNAYLAMKTTQNQADATLGLTYFAALGGIAAISFALASMGLLFGDKALDNIFGIKECQNGLFWRLGLISTCFSITSSLVLFLLKRYTTNSFVKLKKSLCCWVVGLVTISIVCFSIHIKAPEYWNKTTDCDTPKVMIKSEIPAYDK
jgi:hypothetical protein